MEEQVYLRRVRNPEALLQELARQAVNHLEQMQAARGASSAPFPAPVIRAAAATYGVPLDYVLDEVERRVRARV